ncbi:response regulator [Deinococcus sonorensis]|uniref:Response regulator n=2 Tax=Deinococcus sonorensis TaxID=309891 RepID=A0AAU7UFL9_9DEIO
MKRVLLVEDHLPDALLLTELLELAGVQWQVGHAQTFAHAVQCWTAGPYELLLLDLDITDGWGLELLERALALVEGAPVVVLSGQDNPVVAAQAVQMGAHAYVVKGFDAAERLVTLMDDPPADQVG